MLEAGIPTAKFGIFGDMRRAREYIKSQGNPLVIKADGLAAGKGVIVCDSKDQALEAAESILDKKEFGAAGERIVIEERLEGEEASFIALCDGENFIPLATSQDHKRVFDGDRGPNTGGMGAYSPAPVIDDFLFEEISKKVMRPAVETMKNRGTPFSGFLYAGIMIEEDTGRPMVLEFNARMGDPECQPIVMRMKSDLFPYLEAAVDTRLAHMPQIEWSARTAVCVVMAAKGYPGSYERGKVIEGLSDGQMDDSMIFHAGTVKDGQKIVTDGGRVLGVTALGKDPAKAAENAYSIVRRIRWGDNDHQYRTDIARRAIMRRP
jgi:phosphoribosylamine--glycine ligase